MRDRTPNDHSSWKRELERIKEFVKKSSCLGLGGDSLGMFFKKIGGFSDFLLKDGKEKDPDVIALFDFFRRFHHDLCPPDQLKANQGRIVDLCIKICRKFEKQSAA